MTTIPGLCAALLSLLWVSSAAAMVPKTSGPTIQLDAGRLTGTTSASGDINLFLGIPFAQPPVGDLRFRLPRENAPYFGTINATVFGPACLQQTSTVDIPQDINPIAAQVLASEGGASVKGGDSEDCLTVNVITPANAAPSSKLPVVFWIYGGGFEFGGTSLYNGTVIVERSLELHDPVVYVSVNYRVAAVGFPGGSEVREAGIGNLGLHDQRLGLRWVQKYISKFGGDPEKVTIWGESAGAISVASQMITNGGDTEGLFRAAFMQSGSPLPSGPIEDGQPYFDIFATVAGCAESLGSTAVFDCLRNVSTEVIRNATNATPGISSFESLSLAWVPREDGVFFKANPQQLVVQGSVAAVPFVTGNNDDEGTIFSLTNSNLTTDDEVEAYLAKFYIVGNNSTAAVKRVLELYPDDPAQGSPFDTGSANAITPQYKRIAAILGDIVFQAPRRFFQSSRAGLQTQFAFLNKRGKSNPVVGSFHGSDTTIIYGPSDLTDYLVRFVARLDPNGATGITWPAYTPAAPSLLTLLDGVTPLTLSNDTFRLEGMQAIVEAELAHPL
ncbi:carotenoid ester lipase precursor [Vararia minispora EC-137]|uniref:Carotenoid ester lipase n=1 Tax=Vararia minispora EC-137 TaxID=1314806 RepID=A0ACB8QXD0_9AGAM|nr:carotenoid ester lipase precursor [Vararia minispora EC-137]